MKNVANDLGILFEVELQVDRQTCLMNLHQPPHTTSEKKVEKTFEGILWFERAMALITIQSEIWKCFFFCFLFSF